ncbi:uncharacterized protein LOC103305707 isoform X3 [Chrysemys picta bellii]|uniref:uncharacterized protein LOC103305707 isoform X3 n=1 Tax=Chrysemys picta bellii TaxID=8478 RepID=UPI0032B17DBD
MCPQVNTKWSDKCFCPYLTKANFPIHQKKAFKVQVPGLVIRVYHLRKHFLCPTLHQKCGIGKKRRDKSYVETECPASHRFKCKGYQSSQRTSTILVTQREREMGAQIART